MPFLHPDIPYYLSWRVTNWVTCLIWYISFLAYHLVVSSNAAGKKSLFVVIFYFFGIFNLFCVFYQADLTLKCNFCTDPASGNGSTKITFNL
jgi:hypothetical protein